MPKIEYKMWQPLGPGGCLYIHDIDKSLYSKTKNVGRKAWFVCPRCGNGFLTWIASVKNGKTRSCGCLNQEQAAQLGHSNAKDIAGQRFGFLTAIEQTNKKYEKRRTYYWKCLCDCGKQCPLEEEDRYVEVIISDLTSGHCTKSNKCHFSSGEMLVNNSLKQLGLDFYCQHMFDDCVNPNTGAKLRFDFYIPSSNCCIEYDGEQHFLYQNNNGWNTKEKYEETIYRDNLKNKYCLSHNIKMIRIPYTNLNKISPEYLSKLLE